MENFKVSKGFVWKMFKAGKQLSELSDLDKEIKQKFEELERWFVANVKSAIADADMEKMSQKVADKMAEQMATIMRQVTQERDFPLEATVNSSLKEAEAENPPGAPLSNAQQAKAMDASKELIKEATGLSADEMRQEFGEIKEILAQMAKTVDHIDESVDKLTSTAVFMLVVVRLPVSFIRSWLYRICA